MAAVLLAAGGCVQAAAQELVAFEVAWPMESGGGGPSARGPVRFGVPLRARDLERGMRLKGATPGAVLQWEPLPTAVDPVTGRIWVEVAVVGLDSGRCALVRGGGCGPSEEGEGPAFERRTTSDQGLAGPMGGGGGEGGTARIGRGRETVWVWSDGTVDRRHRVLVDRSGTEGGLLQGEALRSESACLAQRAAAVVVPARWWRSAGMLPDDRGLGRGVRARLYEAWGGLPRARDARGAGDFVRGEDGETVTNLEYDTTLGVLRLAWATGDRELLAAARASALHLADVDLDPKTGLFFRHGPDHRRNRPEPGHVWLTGLALTAAATADRELLETARGVAEVLAHTLDPRPDRPYRARDLGWPLLELEFAASFFGGDLLRRAADAHAERLLARFDPARAVFRFDEGEPRRRDGSYVERAWITGGILLPALRAHVRRTGSHRAREAVRRVEERILEQIARGRAGLPVRWTVDAGGRSRSAVGVRDVPEAFLLLDGLSERAQRRLLGRGIVQRALDGVPRPGHPDRATDWSMVARCWWVMR